MIDGCYEGNLYKNLFQIPKSVLLMILKLQRTQTTQPTDTHTLRELPRRTQSEIFRKEYRKRNIN